jgi:hypothetical protein
MVRRLNASGHKSLKLSEVYAIDSIEIKRIDAMASDRHSKGEPVMRTVSATGDQMGAETREPMVDLTSHSVSFALLQGQLLAGEISRSAILDRASRSELPSRQHEQHVLNSEALARVAPTGRTQGELA